MLIALGRLITIEAAMVRPEFRRGETKMATIGTFTKSGEDFTGTVKTIALNVKAKIARAEKENDKAPDSASSPARPNLARPGRRPRPLAANISRLSLTIRASRRLSSPRWSRPKAGTPTPSSGPAATAIEAD